MGKLKSSEHRCLDKDVEQKRYNDYANSIRVTGNIGQQGAEGVDEAIRAPYIAYRDILRNYLLPGIRVLELGSGSGMHTGSLVSSGAVVIALDISEHSLNLLLSLFDSKYGNVDALVGDIEYLPVRENSMDLVCAAGVLSYGKNDVVMNEVYRVLRPGGVFICVDSLDNNPIYRFNRWLHYLRGNRTKSTLLYMPSLKTLKKYEEKFGEINIKFFGGLSFLTPLLSPIIGRSRMSAFSNWFDRIIRVRRLAFKFVMISKKG